MKTKFFSEVPMLVGLDQEIPAGTLIGTIETPDGGLDAEAVVRAIARGIATRNEPPSKAQAAANTTKGATTTAKPTGGEPTK